METLKEISPPANGETQTRSDEYPTTPLPAATSREPLAYLEVAHELDSFELTDLSLIQGILDLSPSQLENTFSSLSISSDWQSPVIVQATAASRETPSDGLSPKDPALTSLANGLESLALSLDQSPATVKAPAASREMPLDVLSPTDAALMSLAHGPDSPALSSERQSPATVKAPDASRENSSDALSLLLEPLPKKDLVSPDPKSTSKVPAAASNETSSDMSDSMFAALQSQLLESLVSPVMPPQASAAPLKDTSSEKPSPLLDSMFEFESQSSCLTLNNFEDVPSVERASSPSTQCFSSAQDDDEEVGEDEWSCVQVSEETAFEFSVGSPGVAATQEVAMAAPADETQIAVQCCGPDKIKGSCNRLQITSKYRNCFAWNADGTLNWDGLWTGFTKKGNNRPRYDYLKRKWNDGRKHLKEKHNKSWEDLPRSLKWRGVEGALRKGVPLTDEEKQRYFLFLRDSLEKAI